MNLRFGISQANSSFIALILFLFPHNAKINGTDNNQRAATYCGSQNRFIEDNPAPQDIHEYAQIHDKTDQYLACETIGLRHEDLGSQRRKRNSKY